MRSGCDFTVRCVIVLVVHGINSYRRIVEEGKISSNVEYKNEYIADRFATENGY